MTARPAYDDFAAIYDAWVDGVAAADEMRSFYVELLLAAADGPVVELGVGNGRICIEAARRGRRVIGVDSSAAILELCRRRADEAGVADRLELIAADFRDFELEQPASLVVIPFHSIGHLPTDEEKLRCMARIHSQLAPGGRFVWDHFIFDSDYPTTPGTLNLRADVRDADGRGRLVWELSTRDAERRMIDILVRIEEVDATGAVEATRYVRMEMSWIAPERSRELLERAGFEIEALYGDFRRGPFEDGASHQVWCARRSG